MSINSAEKTFQNPTLVRARHALPLRNIFTNLFPFILFLLLTCANTQAEDGSRLWLRFDPIENSPLLQSYRQTVTGLTVEGTSETEKIIQTELASALKNLLGQNLSNSPEGGKLIVGTPESSALIARLKLDKELKRLGPEGYVIRTLKEKNKTTVIASQSPIGALYGTFYFLRLLQTHQPIEDLNIVEKPKVKLRVLDHWDNLDGTIERGYAGKTLWNWKELPGKVDQRLKDYARANASIGINGSVLNNVNSNPIFLTEEYLHKIAAIASVFRPYGIKVYLAANFAAPKKIGGMTTSDPLDPQVAEWWKTKVDEIYKIIPDFGGFLVKANSENQSGPQDYGRTHADGANLLAKALQPHGGIVMWRSFVYNADVDPDRINRAYKEFKPLDGKFLKNVLIQSKNGALDFQPREPFSPLFGALRKTPLMAELQVTQEYLGHSNHLVYLGTMWEEFFKSDTYSKGPYSTVARVVEGKVFKYQITGVAGVANTGTDRNWTGHLFGQANWYAFGRFAWNPESSAKEVSEEWTRMTWGNDPQLVNPIVGMMMGSRETYVNYVTPLGLSGVFEKDLHYAPDPGMVDPRREDWSAAYYVRADEKGLGFNRTLTGSRNVNQYHPPLNHRFNGFSTCPEKFLLWFHHVAWGQKMKSGKPFWEELCSRYDQGVSEAGECQKNWDLLKGKVDGERFGAVADKLKIQVEDAKKWRDKCLLYFQTFSHQPLPAGKP